jgi:glutathione peroxidase
MRSFLRSIMICGVGIVFLSTSVSLFSKGNSSMTSSPVVDNVFGFAMKDIDGKQIKLDTYKGKVMLIVNVASQCGYTPQYEGLQKLYEKYKDMGVVVLGFPANDFGMQEPGTDAEIKNFCSSKYNVNFPMFSKISVKGDKKHPLYQYLIQNTNNQDVKWNFGKFLVGKDGKVIARFESSDKPDSEKIAKAIEAALK